MFTALSKTMVVSALWISLSSKGITDELLAEMISNGEIPQNVTNLCLLNNQISDLTPLAELTNLQFLN
jgi:Leucine-rich repeat (LRR) protein